jgi:lactam utilization protein B
MNRVDLNCDLGESFGAYRVGMDEDILPFVTSQILHAVSCQGLWDYAKNGKTGVGA